MEGWEVGTHVWELVLLRIVATLQRETKTAVTTTAIYHALEQGTFKELTEKDLRRAPEWGGLPAYQYKVLAYLSRLAGGKHPDLQRVSRGVYRITDKGERRVRRTFLRKRNRESEGRRNGI